MRSANDYRADLEGDLAERYNEISLIERLISGLELDVDKARLRRALILLAYAHLEGFCKFALITYASAINAARLTCSEASYAIAASSMAGVFSALRDKQRKHPIFNGSESADIDVHLLQRERTFIREFTGSINSIAYVRDDVIDTQSNLKPEVLKKLLFRLDLDFSIVNGISSNLNRLLGIRNAIAHGDRLKQPGSDETASYIGMVRDICEFLLEQVDDAIRSQRFRASA